MLCPLYSHNPEVLLNELMSPSDLLDFGEFSDCIDFGSGAGSPLLHVVNPVFDYMPPKLVNLLLLTHVFVSSVEETLQGNLNNLDCNLWSHVALLMTLMETCILKNLHLCFLK
ncbi:uncharacterized protein LOC130795617 [Actinidia eriantha]|uniref:uncharacterized protein LOC130795617 n=1 Tax=Actinidia eriantha TaxID=165200 RepID=UPI00258F7749|nr:uncharacterized protein LOC130795617 [Actinidia eriantha]